MCCQANEKAQSLGALAALERIQLQFPAPKLDGAQQPVTAAKGTLFWSPWVLYTGIDILT